MSQHCVPRNSPKYNRERPLVTFIDVEASGVDMQQSYPIEMAWVDSLGNADRFLIRPSPEWTHWEPKAKIIHGISRETLIRADLSVEQAAERLSDTLGLERVYSDAPDFDAQWIDTLFCAARVEHDFKVLDLRVLFTEICPDATERFRHQVALTVPMHRAEADARRYALAYAKVQSSDPAV